ncbi:carbamoyltransferase HypF [Kibdelosporangium philippinense]|uniref:Carbamoyltransferase n=1 Tax=Kibdelosporangium philippinense TaxID=211113 RepID=A0ABS8ZG93_9PSEU|nr:carbamoyltransferase HypF [Kibdelosporangium philippinense]MCE7006848.1 carbamoyltransferase HypF [Kibdelosporangium philippinense]
MRRDVRVEGVVQGVGFRPFVYSLATGLGLAGRVGNDVNGVFVELEGPPAQIDEFLTTLRTQAPPLAEIERVTVTSAEVKGDTEFTIAASETGGPRRTLISADSATCADCLGEMWDPADRRYRYPFINCTNCGPRFTIIRDVPYDRPFTTMAGFEMCAECAVEYHDPADRRFHAQPTCCPACGPSLTFTGPPGDPIQECANLLKAGKIVAIKGLGGYHLSTLATDPDATARLRHRKHREDKPFAVMVADIETAHELCQFTDDSLLTSRARPIVLLPKQIELAPAVAPGNRHLGLMLPYTPLHHLLMDAVGAPIVLTSGNVSDEPIAYKDEDAFERLKDIADAFLTHDRAIHMRTDDSVVRPNGVVRRSRGYVPEPISISRAQRPILACGAELKNTFCLLQDRHAFMSHHIGDLENYETLKSFTTGIEHFKRLFDIRPEVVAHDLHPEYLSTKYALDLTDVDHLGIQHHHAHIASCLADNGFSDPVIGVAFDGLGYGTDGTIWGGEFLIADLARFERVGHLAPIPMPGGTAAIKQPWRMAAAYLDAAQLTVPLKWENIVKVARSGVNSPLTSSAGRLFDAVSALLGVRETVNYEGQAAIELEQLADPGEKGRYQAEIANGIVSGVDLVKAVSADLAAGVGKDIIAARFHNGVAGVVARVCAQLRDEHDLNTVALSGGVFQNLLLLNRVKEMLQGKSFHVLTHSRVPTNDGGISLGQAVIAARKDLVSG